MTADGIIARTIQPVIARTFRIVIAVAIHGPALRDTLEARMPESSVVTQWLRSLPHASGMEVTHAMENLAFAALRQRGHTGMLALPDSSCAHRTRAGNVQG